jgi:hypothetical protein
MRQPRPVHTEYNFMVDYNQYHLQDEHLIPQSYIGWDLDRGVFKDA